MFKYYNRLNNLANLNQQITRNASTVDLTQRLKGKRAIVTASTEGIGLAIARRLGQEVASVVICSRKQANVEQTVDELKKLNINVNGTVCHVGKESDRKSLVQFALDKIGGIDILVSNAAVNPVMGPILNTSSDAWDKIFDVNVKAAFELTKEVVPHLEKNGGGSIVYISSVAGYQAMPMIGAYSVSKTALLGLSRTLAVELASKKIRVNSVAPGVIRTKFSEAIADSELVNIFTPLARPGESDEIAGVVSFLVSEDASYITGECITPAGGFFSRL